MNRIFKGLLSATFTPMHADGSVNLSTIPRIVEHLITNKINGIYICGSTGEGHSLTLAERKQVAEAYVAASSGRLKTIINVGHNCITDACELALHARSIGTDAISAAPPIYYKINTEEQLISIFERITSEVPDIPFYYYHIPGVTGVRLDMIRFLELGNKHLPTLSGIKFTSPEIHEYQSCLDVSDGRYEIFYGMDEMLLSGLAVGAQCMIGSTFNFMAPLYHEIISNFKAGDLETAKSLQLQAVNIIKAFLKYDSLPAQKVIMRMVGLDCGPVALPLRNLDQDQETALKKALEGHGIFKWSGVSNTAPKNI